MRPPILSRFSFGPYFQRFLLRKEISSSEESDREGEEEDEKEEYDDQIPSIWESSNPTTPRTRSRTAAIKQELKKSIKSQQKTVMKIESSQKVTPQKESVQQEGAKQEDRVNQEDRPKQEDGEERGMKIESGQKATPKKEAFNQDGFNQEDSEESGMKIEMVGEGVKAPPNTINPSFNSPSKRVGNLFMKKQYSTRSFSRSRSRSRSKIPQREGTASNLVKKEEGSVSKSSSGSRDPKKSQKGKQRRKDQNRPKKIPRKRQKKFIEDYFQVQKTQKVLQKFKKELKLKREAKFEKKFEQKKSRKQAKHGKLPRVMPRLENLLAMENILKMAKLPTREESDLKFFEMMGLQFCIHPLRLNFPTVLLGSKAHVDVMDLVHAVLKIRKLGLFDELNRFDFKKYEENYKGRMGLLSKIAVYIIHMEKLMSQEAFAVIFDHAVLTLYEVRLQQIALRKLVHQRFTEEQIYIRCILQVDSYCRKVERALGVGANSLVSIYDYIGQPTHHLGSAVHIEYFQDISEEMRNTFRRKKRRRWGRDRKRPYKHFLELLKAYCSAGSYSNFFDYIRESGTEEVGMMYCKAEVTVHKRRKVHGKIKEMEKSKTKRMGPLSLEHIDSYVLWTELMFTHKERAQRMGNCIYNLHLNGRNGRKIREALKKRPEVQKAIEERRKGKKGSKADKKAKERVFLEDLYGTDVREELGRLFSPWSETEDIGSAATSLKKKKKKKRSQKKKGSKEQKGSKTLPKPKKRRSKSKKMAVESQPSLSDVWVSARDPFEGLRVIDTSLEGFNLDQGRPGNTQGKTPKSRAEVDKGEKSKERKKVPENRPNAVTESSYLDTYWIERPRMKEEHSSSEAESKTLHVSDDDNKPIVMAQPMEEDLRKKELPKESSNGLYFREYFPKSDPRLPKPQVLARGGNQDLLTFRGNAINMLALVKQLFETDLCACMQYFLVEHGLVEIEAGADFGWESERMQPKKEGRESQKKRSQSKVKKRDARKKKRGGTKDKKTRRGVKKEEAASKKKKSEAKKKSKSQKIKRGGMKREKRRGSKKKGKELEKNPRN